MQKNDIPDWHALKPHTVFQILGTSDQGLSDPEAKSRLERYGSNTLQLKRTETIPRIFFRQLKNPIVYVLLLSTFLALILRKFNDSLVIFAVVILNTLIGFIQEYRASKIIRSLTAMVPQKTTVIRNNDSQMISVSQVVPGDAIFLQAGDRVPADLRLISTKNLQCDESALTGESVPVAKKAEPVSADTFLAERTCMAYSGTYVNTGTGVGIVTATGMYTEFGKISSLMEATPPLTTPLLLTLKKIALWITWGVLVSGALLFAVGYLRGSSLFDSAFAAITLAVAAIPEGLPAIVTIASAVGVHRMGQKNAVVRQLPAVEALGSTTIICTDKTGTLTHNEMMVQQLWTPSGFSQVTGEGFLVEGSIHFEEGNKQAVLNLIRAAVLCNDASLNKDETGWTQVGDPTEIALVVAGRKAGINEDAIRAQWPRIDVIPFESEKRMMVTLNASPSNQKFIFLKGSPEEIFPLCKLETQETQKLHEIVKEMAADGLRVLVAAEKDTQNTVHSLAEEIAKKGFNFLGIIGMIDPPRKEVYKAVSACQSAHITVKMVTGDHPFTARAVARELGIIEEDQEVISGTHLNQLEESQWKEIALNHHVFARVSPEHKLKLVTALQESGHVVAMTGDGVNDAAALKRADIGVAMGIRGTAIAKEAADMILVDDNFASIEAAVEEGRRVYDNLIKALSFVLPTSLGQALIILIAILFFPIHNGTFVHPMQPVQILWINLVVAIALALPLAFEAQESNIMKRPPRKKSAPVFSGFILFRTFAVSFLMAICAIGLFLWEYTIEISANTEEHIALAEAQTMAVTALMFFQMFYLFHCRTLQGSVLRDFFSNPALLIGVGVALIAQIAFTYVPFMHLIFHSASINFEAWLISAGVAFGIFLIIALERVLSYLFFFKKDRYE